MNTTRIIAATFAACATFTLLSAMLSIAEPQRSTLQAMHQAPADPMGSMQVAAAQGKAQAQAQAPSHMHQGGR